MRSLFLQQKDAVTAFHDMFRSIDPSQWNMRTMATLPNLFLCVTLEKKKKKAQPSEDMSLEEFVGMFFKLVDPPEP